MPWLVPRAGAPLGRSPPPRSPLCPRVLCVGVGARTSTGVAVSCPRASSLGHTTWIIMRGPRLCLKGRGAIGAVPEWLQSGHRRCECGWRRRLLAVRNAVGAGVGVWECLWGRVSAVGKGGTPPPPRGPGGLPLGPPRLLEAPCLCPVAARHVPIPPGGGTATPMRVGCVFELATGLPCLGNIFLGHPSPMQCPPWELTPPATYKPPPPPQVEASLRKRRTHTSTQRHPPADSLSLYGTPPTHTRTSSPELGFPSH